MVLHLILVSLRLDVLSQLGAVRALVTHLITVVAFAHGAVHLVVEQMVDTRNILLMNGNILWDEFTYLGVPTLFANVAMGGGVELETKVHVAFVDVNLLARHRRRTHLHAARNTKRKVGSCHLKSGRWARVSSATSSFCLDSLRSRAAFNSMSRLIKSKGSRFDRAAARARAVMALNFALPLSLPLAAWLARTAPVQSSRARHASARR